ncbi:MAG TPA: DUF6299 family protein [Candidatus Limnocylindria bacterium]|jgi:hypothetical protein
MKRIVVLAGMAAVLNLALVGPALATAPANDLYAGRVAVGSLPFSDSLDTTEATTDAADVEANTDCGAPATAASVWYELTPVADMDVLVDVSASDYEAGVIVVTGSTGSFSFVDCGAGAVPFSAQAGETYAILAFDFVPAGGSGGQLEIAIDLAPPAPELSVTVDSVAHFDKSGNASVSGTVTCAGVVDFAFVDVDLRQRVGRFVISGFGSTDLVCDGATHAWSAEIFADNGLFKGGKAQAQAFAVACGPVFCNEVDVARSVRLRGGRT